MADFPAEIRTLSEFRANIAAFVEHVRLTEESIVLTHYGRGAAVLVAFEAYHGMLDELAHLRGLREGERLAAGGAAASHESVSARLRAHAGR